MTKLERIMSNVPDYYQNSQVLLAMQSAIADELDKQNVTNLDIQKQLYLQTATWGLKYWEELLSIPASESYDVRRGRVLSFLRGVGNFSAKLIYNTCLAFGIMTSVTVTEFSIAINVIQPRGELDSNIAAVVTTAIDNIIHAHMGFSFNYAFLSWIDLDNSFITWDTLDAKESTWPNFEKWDGVS